MATRGWNDVTQADINRRILKQQPKPSKYRNVRYETQGEKFDSKHEANVWMMLKAREGAGEIIQLRRQVPFPLYAPAARQPYEAGEAFVIGSPTIVKNISIQVAEYIADFVYFDRPSPSQPGERHVLDAKSKATRTAVYKLKKKWLELQDGIIIEEV